MIAVRQTEMRYYGNRDCYPSKAKYCFGKAECCEAIGIVVQQSQTLYSNRYCCSAKANAA